MYLKKPTLIKNQFISVFIGTCGIIIAFSFVFPIPAFSFYIASYIHEKQKFVTMYYGLFFHLIFSLSMSLGQSLGGFLELIFGFYLTNLFGPLLILIADIFFLNAQNIWLCYVLIFFIATGGGISNSLIGKNIAFFKPGRKGLLISIMTAIIHIFSGGLSIAGEKLINPDGYTLNKTEEYYDYKYSSKTYIYFTIGFFSIPIGVIIFILFIIEYKKNNKSNSLEEKKEEIESNEEIEESENRDIKDIKDIKEEENELIISKEAEEMKKKHKIKKAVKSIRYWRFSFAQFLIAFSYSYILGTSRTFGALIGIEGNALQYLMMCQSGATVVISPLLGFFVDKKGPLFFLRISSLILIIPGILLTLFIDNTYIFITSFVISVLGFITGLVCVSPFVMDIYGIQESAILGGIMNLFIQFSSSISTVVAFVISLFYNKEEIILPYKIIYSVGSGCCLVGFILLMFEKKDKFNYEDENKENLGNLVENGRFTIASEHCEN